MRRLLYLDNLKVCLTVLVIFHHAGQAYGDGGAWAYTPSNPAEVMPWIWHFFSVNAAFFMGLFFLISGYFIWWRHGCWQLSDPFGQSAGSLDMAFRHHPLANGTCSLSAIRDDVRCRHSGQSHSLA